MLTNKTLTNIDDFDSPCNPNHYYKHMFFTGQRPEATCASAIRTAKDFVKDVGTRVAARSGGLLRLSRCNDASNSERDAHRVLVNQLELSLQIPISDFKAKDPKLRIPLLSLRDWCKFFLDNNCWHITTGLMAPDPKRTEVQWGTFWRLYRKQCPSHEIFVRADNGDINLETTAAILLHGDEGRGRQKKAFLVLSWHSILGRGTQPGVRATEDGRKPKPYAKLEPNFRGHSYTTRFLLAALTKKSYTHENDCVFHGVLDSICEDFRYLSTTGMTDPFGKRHWMVLLHVCGDWPFLAKAGQFTRSFNNITKRANATRREPTKGVCHLCRAGQDTIPYEQIQTRRPVWLQTSHESLPYPAESPPPFTRLPHIPNRTASIWYFDLFHSFHLGMGRNFVGAVLALYSTLELGGNIDERFEQLSLRYRSYCSSRRIGTIISRITKESISWPTTGHFPTAGWHKGALTTNMMGWIEHRGKTEDMSREPLLSIAYEGCTSINAAISLMYESGAFLEPAESYKIGGLIMQFLRRYSTLSVQSQERNKTLFVLMPKAHVMHHMALELLDAAENNIPILNPICMSVQQSEDFIGRPSRISRKVSPRTTVMYRVVQRYLQSCYAQWLKAGLLRRPS